LHPYRTEDQKSYLLAKHLPQKKLDIKPNHGVFYKQVQQAAKELLSQAAFSE
jgi:hypothetical protein